MPATTRNRVRQRPICGRGPKPSQTKLYPVDLATWNDGRWARHVFSDTLPEEIDEPWPYRFESGDKACIRACDGVWYQGKVVGRAKKGKMQDDPEGLWWCIQFRIGRINIRKWVAPLNGDVKPDTEHTRRLLSDAGRLPGLDGDEKCCVKRLNRLVIPPLRSGSKLPPVPTPTPKPTSTVN